MQQYLAENYPNNWIRNTNILSNYAHALLQATPPYILYVLFKYLFVTLRRNEGERDRDRIGTQQRALLIVAN